MTVTKTLYQGDHKTFELTVVDQDDAVVDISGSAIKMTVKKQKEDASYVIQKTFTLTDPTNGIAEVEFVPTDTSTLYIDGDEEEFVFDVEITTQASKVYTLLEGKFIIKRGVT